MKHKIKVLFLLCALVASHLSAQADLRDGLVSYWPLDSLSVDPNTGQNMSPDLGPNTNNLLDNFTMTSGDIVPGMRGNAASFDGVGKHLRVTYNTGDDIGLPVYNARYSTIAMWVRDRKYQTGTNQTAKAIFAEGNTASANSLFRITTDWASSGRTNLLAVAIRNQNNNRFFGFDTFADLGKTTGTNMPFDGNWHHIAWVETNGSARVYIDGQLDPKVYKNIRIPEPADVAAGNRGLVLNTLSIGAIVQNTVNSYFNGLIDDVAVWERALTQDEINNLRTNGIPLPITAAAPTIVNQPVGNTNLLVGQSWAMQALASGAHPRTYHWFKDGVPLVDDGVAIFGSTSNLLVLPSLDLTNSGSYIVYVTNSVGSTSSSAVDLLVSTVSPQTPSLTNGMISYWPLDQVQGLTTPDVVRGYDMLLGTGLGVGNVVPGKWGNAIKFNTNGILSRIHSPSDDLPLAQYRNFTVSAWINAPTNSAGGANAGARYFAEGNSSSTQPWLSLGQVDNGGQGPLTSARIFVRNDANQNNPGAGVSSLPVFYDPGVSPGGEWHHIVYIQEELGGAVPLLAGRLYVDGVRDTSFNPSPRLPRTAQNTTIGGALRTSISGAFGGGAIDDVAVWKRALTEQEVAMLYTNVTPAAPPVLAALQINSFRPDFPEVVSGDTAILRWAVSGSPLALDIDQGIGSVLSRTTNGFGSIILSNVTVSRTYTLTIQRGASNVTAQATIAVVNGVAAGWSILDNFETYNLGGLANPFWSDLTGGSTIEDVGGNRLLNVSEAGGNGRVALLPLSTLAINQGQARTVFARVYVQDDPAATTILSDFGVTDKGLRSHNDMLTDAGPIVRLNDDSAGDLAIGGRNGVAVPETPANPLTLIPRKLEYQQVYNVWLDITNGVYTTNTTGDQFSIWIQRLGETGRTLIASNWNTDRDLVPDFLTATGINLDQLVVGNGNGSGTVYLDDIYISKSGYNSTVPAPWTGLLPPLPAVPVMTTDTVSAPGQIQFTWDAGALMTAPTLTGPWSVVTDSFGFFYSLPIDSTRPQQFLRIQR